MMCNECGKSMKFRSVGYRGERKGKEFWTCRCGYEETIDLLVEVKENRAGRKSRKDEDNLEIVMGG